MKTSKRKEIKKVFYYDIDLDWIKERIGILSNPELNDKVEVSFPHEKEGTWSPEHLLTGAVNSCFMITFLSIAKKSELEILNYSSPAKGKVEKVNGKFLVTEIIIKPEIIIAKKSDKKKTKKLLKKSEEVCLIANSIKAKIAIKTKIKTKPKAYNAK